MATALLAVAIVVLGVLGYRLLPVAALPDVDFPTIQVVTSYPGASPEVVETSITAPLEHRFGQISGLTSMSSTGSYGTSEITLTFDLSCNIDAAAQDVQAAIDASAGWIPIALLPGPPTYQEVNPADVPVLILGLTSDTMPLEQVNDAAATTLVQNAELAARYNGKPAVILDIQRQPGANTIRVVEAARALLPKLRAELPPTLEINVVTDRTVTSASTCCKTSIRPSCCCGRSA